MQSTNTSRSQTTHRKGRGSLAATALALGIGTIVFASPAAARDEFKNAFEFELGRIVAHEVASIGHAIIRPHSRVYHAPIPPVVYAPQRTVVRRVHRGHGPPAHARAHGHHKHHRSCGHASSHYSRHDRYDRHDRYSRYDRHNRWERRTAKRHARRDHRAEKRHERREHRADRRHERRNTRIDNREYRHGVRASSDRDRRDDRSDRRDSRHSSRRDRHNY